MDGVSDTEGAASDAAAAADENAVNRVIVTSSKVQPGQFTNRIILLIMGVASPKVKLARWKDIRDVVCSVFGEDPQRLLEQTVRSSCEIVEAKKKELCTVVEIIRKLLSNFCVKKWTFHGHRGNLAKKGLELHVKSSRFVER